MGFGLYVADETGKTLLDTSVRCLKILGSFVIPAGTTNYTHTQEIPDTGQTNVFYYAQGNVFNAQGRFLTVPVTLHTFTTSLIGNVLTIDCVYSPVVYGKKYIQSIQAVDVRVFFGVY